MRKRVLTFALTLVLVLSLAGVGSAAGLSPTEKTARFQTESNLALPGLATQAEAGAEMLDTGANPNYIVPAPWSFGQATVIGRTLTLESEINDRGINGYIVAEIYKGTVDSVGENDEPIRYYNNVTGNDIYQLKLSWDTTGMTEGDYVVFYGILDANYKVITATYADLYLSKTEIPLKSVDMFVYELEVLDDASIDTTPDAIMADVNTPFSVALNYEPYHTTADRSFSISTSGAVFAADPTYVFGTGVATSAQPGSGTVTLNCGNISDTMTVYVKTLGNQAITPVTGHELDPETMTVVKEPTATKDGEATGICTICGEEVTVAVPRIFLDTNGQQWYSDAVDYCYANEIVFGLTASKFGPNQSITRGQFVTILYRYDGSGEVTTEEAPRFSDVDPDRFYSDAVVWASKNQLVNGFENGTFLPNQFITREQMATIFFRYVQFKNADTEKRSDLKSFEDAGKVSAYAKEAFQWAVGNEIMNGVSTTMLRPTGQATRAQTAQMLYKLAAYLTPAPEAE